MYIRYTVKWTKLLKPLLRTRLHDELTKKQRSTAIRDSYMLKIVFTLISSCTMCALQTGTCSHNSSTNGVFVRCPQHDMVFLLSTNFFAACGKKKREFCRHTSFNSYCICTAVWCC